MGRSTALIERLRERLRQSPTYRCRFCAKSFDRERLNCPACGSPDVEESRPNRRSLRQ